MKVLLDTSVLVAAMVGNHPSHARASPWLQRVKDKKVEGTVAAHSLAELYSVLTSLPVQPRISPGAAWRLIRENILSNFEIVILSKADYLTTLQSLSENQISGGATYDALIAHASVKAKVDRLITLNPDDFRRVRPEIASRVFSPEANSDGGTLDNR